MKINSAQLRQAFEVLISHIEAHGETTIELPWDLYWDLPRESLYDPYKEPNNFDLGQLTDDWQELEKIVVGEMPPVGYALVWLSSILRAVGENSKV